VPDAGRGRRTGSTGCGFSLEHYRELLEAGKAGGYRFTGFDRRPEPGDLVVRHDVDLSLDAAVRMAEVEAEAGVQSTWFLMTRSVFYNLASKEGEHALDRLRDLGGRIAHHAVWPDVDLDRRFEPFVAWHNPDVEYRAMPIDGAANVMSPPWSDPEHFITDSNQRWRRRGRAGRCPHGELARGSFDWLHLLIHPEIWVYDGETMRETMESFIADERSRRYELLRADRIDLS
jgi:hypothetical protein